MGIRRSKMAFLRLAYYRVSAWNFRVLRLAYYRGIWRTGRPGTREKEIGFERERERERERYPSFQNHDAPALRFGSMNPILRLLGRGSMGESHRGATHDWYVGKKL